MPKIPNPITSATSVTTVRCAACNHAQRDKGRRATCERCGIQPVPSYDYPVGSGLRPTELVFVPKRSFELEN
jgi:hypothetical protein